MAPVGQPPKALQLTSHSALQSSVLLLGIELRRFGRVAEALWLAAERATRQGWSEGSERMR